MSKKHRLCSTRRLTGGLAASFAGLALILSQSAQAATENWTGATNGIWGTNTNWSGSTTPTSADDLTILGPANVAGTLNINVAAAAAANTINFTNTAATTLTNTTSGANQTLTLSSSGTAITTGTGAVTIGSATNLQNVNIALGASQTWNIGSGGMTVMNVISGTGFGITKSGSGTLTLQGLNTYTGATTVSTGTLSFKGANALRGIRGTNTVASGATLQWDATGIGGNATGGNFTNGAAVANGGANTTISGAGTLVVTGNSTDFLGLGNASGRTVTFSMSSGALIDIQGGNVVDGGFSGGVWTSNLADLNIASGASFDTWDDNNTVFVDALTGGGNIMNSSNSATNRTVTVGVDNGSGTFSGVIGGGRGAGLGIGHIALTKNGTGTQTLTGVNTYLGNTTIGGGTLKISGAGQLGSGSYAGTISNAGTFNYDSTAAQTLSGVISGAGALTKTTGTNTLTLTGANTYNGATSVSAGTLLVSGSGAINSTSGITINGSGAKYVHTSTTASTRTITLTQGTVDGTGTLGTVNVASLAGNTVTNGNGSTGTLTIGTLAFAGLGTITVNEANTTKGLALTTFTTANDGLGKITINATNSSAWANGSTYDLITFTSITGGLTDFTKGTITGISGRQNAALGLSGTAVTLTVTGDNPVWTGVGSQTWTTAATNDNTGPNAWALKTAHTATNFWVGDVVEFNDTYDLGSGPTAVTNSTVTITGGVAPSSTTFNNSSVNYTVNSSDSTGITAGSLTKSGTGSVTINTANTYSGGTTLNDGTLNLGNAAAIGTGALTIAGGTLDNTSGSAMTLSSNNAQNWNGSFAFTGTNNLNMGTGAVTLGASPTVTVNGGTLTVGGAIGGLFALTKAGAGTLTLSGASSYSGGTTLNAGTLNINNASAIGTGALTIAGGTTLDNTSGSAITLSTNNAQNWNGDFTFTGTNNLNMGTGAVTLNASPTVTVNAGTLAVGGISGSFALTKAGAGTLTISGASTYSGGTTVNAGTLVFDNNSALGTGTATLIGGTLKAGTSANFTLANAINVTAASTIDSTGKNTTFNGNITGAGNLTLANSGGAVTVALGGNNSGYTGTVTQNNNIAMSFTSANAGSAGAAWVFNDGNADRVRINVAGGGTVNFGSISGSGQIQNDTAGTTTTISVGALNTSTTFGGTIKDFSTGVLALNKVGTGTLTLSGAAGANAYTGATTINGGTLKVNGNIGTSSGVTINGSGATLAGTGTVSAITLTTGTIAPGDNAIGTLTAISLNWAGGNNLTFDLSSSDSTADLLSLSGALTKSGSGSYAFDFSGGLNGQTYTLINFTSNSGFSASDFSVSSGISGTFNLSGTSLTFTAVPEPHEFAIAIVALLGVLVFIRRRNQQV